MIWESNNILSTEILEECKKEAKKFNVQIYDESKTFDMLKVYDFAVKNLSKEDYILFAGAYHDSSLLMLDQLEYKHLYGFDTNEMYNEASLYDELHYTRIKYYKIDVRNTHFPSNFFRAIFALSMIEHLNYRGKNIFDEIEAFFKESSRLLENKGYLVITTDYNDTPRFKKGANIFDKNGILKIVEIAKKYGFNLLSDLDLEIKDKPVHFYHMDYTFVFMSFILNKDVKFNKITGINIIAQKEARDGISIYSRALQRRFEEVGILTRIFTNEKEIDNNDLAILEFFSGKLQILPQRNSTIIEMHNMPASSLKRFLYYSIKERSLSKAIQSVKQNRELKNYLLLIRHPDLIARNTIKISNYFIEPHIAYPDKGIRASPNGICLGSFGFLTKNKRFEGVCELGIRLNVPVIILMSPNDSSSKSKTKKYANKLIKKYSKYKNIKIKFGFFSDEEILNSLKVCSHIVFNQKNTKIQTSGSYRFLTQLGIPIIAVNSFQAVEAQVYRVRSLKEITIEYLENIKEPINQDDGFRYLLNILKYDLSHV